MSHSAGSTSGLSGGPAHFPPPTATTAITGGGRGATGMLKQNSLAPPVAAPHLQTTITPGGIVTVSAETGVRHGATLGGIVPSPVSQGTIGVSSAGISSLSTFSPYVRPPFHTGCPPTAVGASPASSGNSLFRTNHHSGGLNVPVGVIRPVNRSGGEQPPITSGYRNILISDLGAEVLGGGG